MSSITTKTYKDLDLNFIPHPITKDINKKVGVNAVLQSLKNLLFLNHYEKPFHPEIGSNIRKMLFEPIDPVIAGILAKEIQDTITNFEPRVDIRNVYVMENTDGNGFDVTLEFYMVNSPEPITVSFFLERLR
ncbi:COG3628 Phage baseplate assembly protein W [uncultured Caudovirales phage]|uniref:COG3628 Phage baseplate assembly protein W n=1 Tax=uncultured Caudovirales phage TaxID=2100421 RepID=A0A6J5KS69_9CAUD|nr:COG3628 Phage baseplate assembly protein W [uncultured Caudovirales phage]